MYILEWQVCQPSLGWLDMQAIHIYTVPFICYTLYDWQVWILQWPLPSLPPHPQGADEVYVFAGYDHCVWEMSWGDWSLQWH